VKLSILTATAIVALAASSLSAQAGCADLRGTQGTQKGIHIQLPALTGHRASNDASKDIVGTWHATYTVEGNYFADAFIQWHDDGTEWENIDLPISGGNICMGEWVAGAKKTFTRTHIGWLYTDGTVSGYFTETETDKIAKDGNSYAGTNEQKVYDLDGNLLADVTGTSSAMRFGN
jgi:hypothetical protein